MSTVLSTPVNRFAYYTWFFSDLSRVLLFPTSYSRKCPFCYAVKGRNLISEVCAGGKWLLSARMWKL